MVDYADHPPLASAR